MKTHDCKLAPRKGGAAPMDLVTAAMIAEGVTQPESEQQLIEAWRRLHDSGLAYQLQGWFGRRARELLAAGVIADETEGQP